MLPGSVSRSRSPNNQGISGGHLGPISTRSIELRRIRTHLSSSVTLSKTLAPSAQCADGAFGLHDRTAQTYAESTAAVPRLREAGVALRGQVRGGSMSPLWRTVFVYKSRPDARRLRRRDRARPAGAPAGGAAQNHRPDGDLSSPWRARRHRRAGRRCSARPAAQSRRTGPMRHAALRGQSARKPWRLQRRRLPTRPNPDFGDAKLIARLQSPALRAGDKFGCEAEPTAHGTARRRRKSAKAALLNILLTA
jgi:hypothetical protein